MLNRQYWSVYDGNIEGERGGIEGPYTAEEAIKRFWKENWDKRALALYPNPNKPDSAYVIRRDEFEGYLWRVQNKGKSMSWQEAKEACLKDRLRILLAAEQDYEGQQAYIHYYLFGNREQAIEWVEGTQAKYTVDSW